MNKLLAIGFIWLFSLMASAEIQIEIDSSQINFNESFRLTLTQDNLQTNSTSPNLTPLKRDFFIISTERGVNYSVINGQSQSSGTWTVTLKPKKKGVLTIPAIQVGPEQTAPLTLQVTADTNSQTISPIQNRQQSILLATEVNEKKPYVNQQILYKVTLYNSKQLLDGNYQGPKVKDALLIPLDGGKRYQTQKNNVNYLVEEQNYAIFPQKSGPLEITSPVFTALIYDLNPQRVTTEDQTIRLKIQPIPKEFTGKIWLPAKKVKLTEHYERMQSLHQGDTLIRTVTLQGKGVPAQLLPMLHFAQTDAFSTYPEKGKEHNKIAQGELLSNIQIKVTYLFNKSGSITIPALKLPWFNTLTGKEETAILPSKTFEILPSTNPEPVKKQINLPATQESKHALSETKNNAAWIIATLFALAWIITLALWKRSQGVQNTLKKESKRVLKELHQACIQHNPQQVSNALLRWAKLRWPNDTLLNLRDIALIVQDASLKKQIEILSQLLYRNSEKTLWRGDELWKSIQGIAKTIPKKENKISPLPPINPQ